jgi:hypothetical protein
VADVIWGYTTWCDLVLLLPCPASFRDAGPLTILRIEHKYHEDIMLIPPTETASGDRIQHWLDTLASFLSSSCHALTPCIFCKPEGIVARTDSGSTVLRKGRPGCQIGFCILLECIRNIGYLPKIEATKRKYFRPFD